MDAYLKGTAFAVHLSSPDKSVHTLTATETLAEARAARARGDVDGCLRISALAMDKAKEEGDAETEFWAATAPGVMHLGRAEPREAAGYFRIALDTALERGLTLLLGASYHDLYLSARDSGERDTARRYRATSFELYRDTDQRNPRLVALMADWAEEGLMYRPSEETAAFALQSWRACPPSLPGPKERLLAACNQAVAAAWLGLECRYREGMAAMERALKELPDHECAAYALAHASTGASKAGDYHRALRLADRALEIATARGEGAVKERAEEARHAALAERPVAACV